MTPAPALDAVLARIDQDLPQALDRLLDLLRIPSISTDPAFKPDCARAADWLVKTAVAGLWTPAPPPHPATRWWWPMAAQARVTSCSTAITTCSPWNPASLWHRDPFDPEVQDTPKGKVIRARGSSDDKGQLMTFIEACRAWKAVHGSLPGKLTIFLEGEEESGSPSLVPFLQENRDELACDLALICDTGLFEGAVPAITTMLRGLAEIRIHPARCLA